MHKTLTIKWSIVILTMFLLAMLPLGVVYAQGYHIGKPSPQIPVPSIRDGMGMSALDSG